MPLRNMFVLLGAAMLSLLCYERAARNRYISTLAEALHLIDKSYVEEVDSRVLFEGAINGMIDKLDSNSGYISPEKYRSFKAELDQEFGGIGIIVEENPVSKRLTIMTPLMDTPAYRAGLKPGDTILRVGDRDTENMTMLDSVNLMRGPIGSEIHLTIQPAGETSTREVTLLRASIPIDSVFGDTRSAEGKWDFHWEEDRRLGFIRIGTFGEHTVRELRRALATFEPEGQGVQGVIIDLRGNSGGLLTAAVEMCDMFLDEGLIVSTHGRDNFQRDSHTAEPGVELKRELPLAILTDRFSASASEIVAACLQDHQRAVICGQRTYGKGTVQNLLMLEGGKSAMRITTATYRRPSGANIHKKKGATDADIWGVLPDPGLEVVLSDEELEKVVKQRRAKDFASLKPQSAKPDPVQDSSSKNELESPPVPKIVEQPEIVPPSTIEAEPEPFDDPQVRKAVEYLHTKIAELK